MAEQREPVTSKRPAPYKRWVCGHQSAGCPCSKGPTEKGRCGVARKDVEDLSATDRKLLDELGPCIPHASPRFSRQTLALNAAILVGGLLLLLMTLPQREEFFVPGELSQSHAQILGNRIVSERCSSCHPNSHQAQQGITQQDLCLNCHRNSLPDAHWGKPHDLPWEQLEQLRSKAPYPQLPEESDVKFVSIVRGADTPSASQPALLDENFMHSQCATCHIEHKGPGHDLKAITNQRCQSCHAEQFQSLSAGHPEFDNYPYSTSRRIAFDHRSHGEYFGKKDQEFQCASCHVDSSQSGAVGSIFRSVSYENSCARCHDEAIAADTVQGWMLLQLPSILPEDRQASEGLGDWPEEATFDYDGELSPILRLLLMADDECREAVDHVPVNGKITSVAADERPQLTRQIARGVRKLVQEVAADGQLAWKRRFTSVARTELGRELTNYEIALIERLSLNLPPDLFRTMETTWFDADASIAMQVERLPASLVSTQDLLGDDDGLLQDWEEEPNEAQIEEPRLVLRELQGAVHVAAGGFYLDKTLLSLRYMPRGHADPFLSAWNEFVHHLADQDIELKIDLASVTPGGCTECHLVARPKGISMLTETAASVGTREKWRSLTRDENVRLFTKFDHTPHLTLPNLADCSHCHRLSTERESPRVSIKELVTDTSISQRLQAAMHENLRYEFSAIKLSQCVSCHRPGAANDGCTQCHNYHVGAAGFRASH